MILDEKKIRRIVRSALLEEKAYDFIYTWNYAAGDVTVIKKGKEYFFTELPLDKLKLADKFKEVSIENPLAFSKAPARLSSKFMKMVADMTIDNDAPAKRIDKPGSNYGMPVLIANNASSRPVSLKILNSIPEDSVLRAKTADIVSSIPEGHVNLIVIEPRTRKPYQINFGVYEKGNILGHGECQKTNDDILSSLVQKVAGIAGFSLMGSVSIIGLGAPVQMAKKKAKDGSLYLDFKDIKSACKDLYSRPNSQFKFDVADIAHISDCRHSGKVLAMARTEKCRLYNVIPGSSIASGLDAVNKALSASSGKGKSIYGTGSDNCASLSYKLASLAKTGKMASSDKTKELSQYPTKTISYAKRSLGATSPKA